MWPNANVVKGAVAHALFKLVVEDICGTLLRAPGHSCNRPLRKWTMLDMLVVKKSKQHREECSTQCFAPSSVLMRLKWMFCHAMSRCWSCLLVGLDCRWKNLYLNQRGMEHQFGHTKSTWTFEIHVLGYLRIIKKRSIKLYAMSQPSFFFFLSPFALTNNRAPHLVGSVFVWLSRICQNMVRRCPGVVLWKIHQLE